MCHGLIPYVCPGIHCVSVGIGHLIPVVQPPAPALSVPITLLLPKCCSISYLISQWSLTLSQGAALALASLPPFLSSFPPCQIIPWSGMTIAKQLQFELSLLCHTIKWAIDLIHTCSLLWNTLAFHWHIHIHCSKTWIEVQTSSSGLWEKENAFPTAWSWGIQSVQVALGAAAGAAGWALGSGSPWQELALTLCPSKLTGTCGTSQGNKLH